MKVAIGWFFAILLIGLTNIPLIYTYGLNYGWTVSEADQWSTIINFYF